MNNTAQISFPEVLRKSIPAILIDIMAVAFIYFVPTISHLLSFPLYLIEPMRIMVVLALIFTHRYNALILAATLPFVSFIFSGHPFFVKSALISAELVINVLLFYALAKKIYPTIALFTSIWVSKILYYGMKYLTILWMFPDDKLISTPLHIQLYTSLGLSIFLFLAFYFGGRKKV